MKGRGRRGNKNKGKGKNRWSKKENTHHKRRWKISPPKIVICKMPPIKHHPKSKSSQKQSCE